MSVIFEGVDMQKACWGDGAYCEFFDICKQKDTYNPNYKPSNCPLKPVEQEPTTKNNLPHCQHSDEEIAKSFIEDVEAVKDQLPCFCEQMDFPQNTFDEFAEYYGFKDKDEVYTNGSELIPVFRVKQWLEHMQEPTTKNNTVGFNKINELADFAIKATGQRDSYSQGMCNGIEYLRATLTNIEPKYFDSTDECKEPTNDDLAVRKFEEIVIEFPIKEPYIYPDYRERPYFGIKYKENGESIVGYGTYSPQVLSRYLKDYFMSTTKNNLGVEEVTALAEWTEKLTKASKDAYNKGYADGMKAQEPRKGHWIYIRNSEVNGLKIVKCSECGKRTYGSGNYCPNCGADMRGEE